MAPEALAGIHFPCEVGKTASSIVPLVSDSEYAGCSDEVSIPSFEVVASELLNRTINGDSRNLIICVPKAFQFTVDRIVIGVWFELRFLYRSIYQCATPNKHLITLEHKCRRTRSHLVYRSQ